VRLDGSYFIDGSIARHIPLEPAIHAGAKRAIILPTGFTCARDTPPQSPLALALLSIHIMLGQQLRAALELYGRRIQIIVAPPLCPIDALMNDFSQTESLMQAACEQTRAWIEGGGLKAGGTVPPELLPHRH